MKIFAYCFCCVSFAAINLIIRIKLLSFVSPCSELTNLKVVLGFLKHSTCKIYPEFSYFIPSLLLPLQSKLSLSLVWDNATVIPPLLPYSQFSKKQPEWSSKNVNLIPSLCHWIPSSDFLPYSRVKIMLLIS